ncbi:MAG: formate dehydrogenase subunit alpha [Methanothrix sp.]|nr:formate dehydrogenase subunit alpha [Methanothrix sp.]
MILQLDEGNIVKASPSALHPVSRGRLCIKGRHAWEFPGHQDRLRYPLIRKGGILVQSSWRDALSLTVKRLEEIRRSDPEAIGVLTSAKGTNEENYLLMKLARSALKTNNVDNVARLCHAPTVVGLSRTLGCGAMTNSINSISESQCILLVGSNTTDHHTMFVPYIRRAKKEGARIIVVDPRRTSMASRADIHLSPRPGTDLAWINSFLYVIFQEGLEDEEFIINRTEGLESLRELVASYPPQVAEAITGIPAENIREAAIAYASVERGAIAYAMGITQHSTGTNNVQGLANLALATGNIGREGTGMYPLRGHQNVQGACDMGALPTVYTGYQQVKKAREKFECSWGIPLPDSPGMTSLQMMEAASAGRLKALIVVGENPMLSYPDSTMIKKALQSLEFLLVWDIFPTETSMLADIVLPGASFVEKDGTFTSMERRVQRVRQAAQPPGEAQPEWKIIAQMLGLFGLRQEYSSPSRIMDEIASLTPTYGGISYSRLGLGGLQWPCPDSSHPGTAIMHVHRFPRGKATFRPAHYKEPYEKICEEYPLLLMTGRSGHRFHTDTMTSRANLPEIAMPESGVEINPADARRLGISQEDMVVVKTRRGQISLKAILTDALLPGTIFIPFHFSQAPANILTGRAVDPLSGTPELKVSAAKVIKLK